ncbi:MAG TPA: DUF4232 domain-containing protein [Actinomycetota bacterium]|nr:DUF4232 domain-containing protein [Actinomycetota bacterium]
MSDMDDRMRDLLRRKADDVPPHRDVPPSMLRRARRRMAANGIAVGAIALVLIVGVFAGFQAFAGSSPPAQPAGQPTTPGGHATPSTAHSPHPGASHSSMPVPPTPTPSQSGSTTTPARCRAGNLQIQEVGSNGAAGSIQVEVSMRNVGSAPCSLEGYPGMLLLSGTTPMQTKVVRGSSVVVPSIAVRLAVLAPGRLAAYVFGYSDVPTGSETCPTSTALEVTPPNAYAHATIPFSSTACGGVLTTSPVFPGVRVPSS